VSKFCPIKNRTAMRWEIGVNPIMTTSQSLSIML